MKSLNVESVPTKCVTKNLKLDVQYCLLNYTLETKEKFTDHFSKISLNTKDIQTYLIN